MHELFDNPINLLHWANMSCHGYLLPVGDYSAQLSIGERNLIHTARQKRIESFSSGRQSARLAMQRAGLDVTELLREPGGNAQWPSTCKGSISHCANMALALVTTEPNVAALGVDIEQICQFDKATLAITCNTAEQQWLNEHSELTWAETALFSIKESLFKCINPITSTWFDFHDISILNFISIDNGSSDFPNANNKHKGGYIQALYLQPQHYELNAELVQAITDISDSFNPHQHLTIRLAVFEKHVVSLAWLQK